MNANIWGFAVIHRPPSPPRTLLNQYFNPFSWCALLVLLTCLYSKRSQICMYIFTYTHLCRCSIHMDFILKIVSKYRTYTHTHSKHTRKLFCSDGRWQNLFLHDDNECAPAVRPSVRRQRYNTVKLPRTILYMQSYI